MLSIIVPVYNVESYLHRCVDSLLGQSYKDIEIILVDDGSTDKSPAICDWYAANDPRVKVIHKENEGQSAARNDALGIAEGEYIGFVDSDDWVEVNYCEVLVSIIENSDLAICSHRILTEENKITDKLYGKGIVRKLDENALWQEIFCKLNNAVWNKLYRKDLIQGISFPLGIFHGEDLLFNLEYINRCKTAAITDLQLYNYYKRANSVTTSSFSAKKEFEMLSKDMACCFVEKNCPALLPVAYRYCFRSRLNVLRSIYRSGTQSSQSALISKCTAYLKDEFNKVRPALSKKDLLEYYLFMNCKILYRLLLKCI
ncbi:MAG: glycosyltransferase [Bacteroidales bacterium]|nr:glycosyltransferase [Bacteroidales bacterium]